MTDPASSDGDATRPAGLVASLRGVLVSVLGIAGTRIELIGLEVAEEKERLVGLLFTVLAAAFALSLAVLLVTFLVIAHFWDSYRLTAIGSFVVLYGAVGGWLIAGLKRELAAHPPLFSATLAELEKDRAALRSSMKRGEPPAA
jgi:uncharacterized membrane protein YqjE